MPKRTTTTTTTTKPTQPNIGALIDKAFKLRSERLALEAKAAELKTAQVELEQQVAATLKRAGLDSGRGKIATASVSTKPVPVLDDAEAFFGYVTKKHAFELLHKRVAERAVLERWEAGETVPGVRRETVLKVSLTKRGGR